MNIPHYPEIITHPMDFSTIERKLNLSNPAKPDPNPKNPRYQTADQFIADVRLVFTNCVKFNGPEHEISQMGRQLLYPLRFPSSLPSRLHLLLSSSPALRFRVPLSRPPCPHPHRCRPCQTMRSSLPLNVDPCHQAEQFHFRGRK